MRNLQTLLSLIVFCLSVASLQAQSLELAPVFSDHMVLQRGMPVRVFGQTTPGMEVYVSFAGQNVTDIADADGGFEVLLDAMNANWDAQTLEIRSGDEVVQIGDVLVGEVWFASGQSNMEKPMGTRHGQRPTDNYETEVAVADFPRIRMFHVPWNGVSQLPDYDWKWFACEPETLLDSTFSAVGYYFARELLARLEVPVGIIDCSFGGTMIETWIPREYLEASEQFAHKLQESYFAWVEGVQASEQYEAMVRPFEGMSVSGFLWYQGESNLLAGEIDNYADKLELMIASWRELWQQEEAPFYLVALAPFRYSSLSDRAVGYLPEALPIMWEQQQIASDRTPFTQMICITDLAEDGRDIHPTNKRDVGIRLAHLVLQDQFALEMADAHAPRFTGFEVGDNGDVIVSFEHAEKGFISSDGNAISGFELAGGDQVFAPAEVEILEGNQLKLSATSVSQPAAIRFGWHESKTSNLICKNGLSVFPFRTDSWPIDAFFAPVAP